MYIEETRMAQNVAFEHLCVVENFFQLVFILLLMLKFLQELDGVVWKQGEV